MYSTQQKLNIDQGTLNLTWTERPEVNLINTKFDGRICYTYFQSRCSSYSEIKNVLKL